MDKLRKRILEDLDIEAYDFKRCYPGYWQRAQGAWSWCASRKDGVSDIGSCVSMTECANSKTPLEIDKSGEIYPNERNNM